MVWTRKVPDVPKPLPPPGVVAPRPAALGAQAIVTKLVATGAVPATIQAALADGAVPGTLLVAPLAPKDGPITVVPAPVSAGDGTNASEPLVVVAVRKLWDSPFGKAVKAILYATGIGFVVYVGGEILAATADIIHQDVQAAI
mgnify:CR=1 FL=1